MRDAAIHRVALADAAEVDAHAGPLEAHRVRRLIEMQVPPVDAGQRAADLRFGRLHVQPVVVEIADARVGDVEGALGDLARNAAPASSRSNSSASTDDRLIARRAR